MGAFPIQTSTSCADEWVINGKTGILIHSITSENIAEAIGFAISNDSIVDSAQEANREVISRRADPLLLREASREFYGL